MFVLSLLFVAAFTLGDTANIYSARFYYLICYCLVCYFIPNVDVAAAAVII